MKKELFFCAHEIRLQQISPVIRVYAYRHKYVMVYPYTYIKNNTAPSHQIFYIFFFYCVLVVSLI